MRRRPRRPSFRLMNAAPDRLRRVIAMLAVAAAALAVLAGCGGGTNVVPPVTNLRLDIAEEQLADAGLEYEVIGGGVFGVIVHSRWYVCAQDPYPGTRATTVKLIVERSCPPSPDVFIGGRSAHHERGGATDEPS